MLFELLETSTHSILRSTVQHFLDERFTIFCTVPRIFNTHIDDVFINGKRVIRIFTKRQFSTDKLIRKNTQRPEINWEAIAFSCYDLWSNVVWSPNDSVGSKPPLDFKFFGGSHVNKFKIAISMHHNVFWFKISIDHSMSMHMFDHDQNLSNQKSGVF